MTNPLKSRTRKYTSNTPKPPKNVPVANKEESSSKNLCDLTEQDYPTELDVILPVATKEGPSKRKITVDAYHMRGECLPPTDSGEDTFSVLWQNVRAYLVKHFQYDPADAAELTELQLMKIWSQVVSIYNEAFRFFFHSLDTPDGEES